jgi:hypothetical protein
MQLTAGLPSACLDFPPFPAPRLEKSARETEKWRLELLDMPPGILMLRGMHRSITRKLAVPGVPRGAALFVGGCD